MNWLRVLRSGLAQRTMLLLVVAVSGSLAVLALGFTLQREDDFATFLDARARAVAAQVHSVRLILLSVPAAYRGNVSDGLLASGTLYAIPASKAAPPQQERKALQPGSRRDPGRRLPGGGSFGFPDISEAISRYTLQPSEVRFVREPGPGYWVSQQIDGETWWIVVLAGDPPPAPGGVPWPAVAAILLALLGVAASYAATITRPLRELSAATHRLGEEWPEPVNVDGPAEIRDLVDSFNSMLLRLRQIEDERKVLIGGLPHDMRAPLTRLRLRLAALTESGEHPGIVDDIASIDRIVHQFTEYLRGAQPNEPHVPLLQIIHSAVNAYRSLGHDVSVDATPDLHVAVPQFSVRRILDNLIDNAVHHGEGPVHVFAAMPTPAIVELGVTDYGKGIPDEMAALALRPFTKLDPARARGGCGLGLAIVRQLVRQLGGAIRFEQGPNSFSVIASIGVK
jgi:two-component system osmolarity sensor histidine kinase EnvZ